MICFFDTSSILTLGDILFDDTTPEWVCSSVTIEELENIKTNESKSATVKYAARKVTRLMDEKQHKYKVHVADDSTYDVVRQHHLPITNDNLILASAVQCGAFCVYSEDILMRHIGKSIFGLNMTHVKTNGNGIYQGVREVRGDENDFNTYMEHVDKDDWNVNEYLIFENTSTGGSSEMRFDGDEFVALKLPSSGFVKAKTPRQRCALDMLMNDNITVAAILGGYGSGKTFLATQMAFYNCVKRNKQQKVLGVREPRGEGKEIGFLPGTFNEKVANFFLPLAQQISGGQYMLEDYMRRGVIETNIPFYMKGTTYNDTVIVVDEAEDLSEQQIRLVGTRVGSNSRIFFAGDYNQSLFDKTSTNPLVRMCREFKGDPKFACVYLDEDVRSDTSKMFSQLFK